MLRRSTTCSEDTSNPGTASTSTAASSTPLPSIPPSRRHPRRWSGMPFLGQVNLLIFVGLFVMALASQVVDETASVRIPPGSKSGRMTFAESAQLQAGELSVNALGGGEFMAKAPGMRAMPSAFASDASPSLGQDIASSFRQSPKSFDASKVDRMLVWNGHVDLVVAFGVSEAWTNLQQRIQELVNDATSNGYIENESEHSHERYIPHDCRNSKDNSTTSCPDGNYGRTVVLRSWSVVWRVPSSLFATSLDAAAALVIPGVSWVKDKSASASDITEQFIDTKSRESMLTAAYNTLEKVLVQATTTAEVMDVMRELQRVAESLDQTQQHAAYLSKSASLSTLRVSIDEAPPSRLLVVITPAIEAHEAEEPWTPAASVSRAFHWLKKTFQWTMDALIVAVIVGGPVAAVATAAVVAGRSCLRPQGIPAYDRVE
ncbi:hypothetical protein H310_03709 [Aphanomyces invadans]|uniref:DUF4349 domain-containing protein n=1 Tax=Aphanomyces invadans TaxID=157072 RepID=A0A024UJR9_9STRA|nr:hypothetical protein H310_03709 [Aphanomyces invadans]ETW06117.1 hypothetical protein H310_03709 [Aphanomyces invadans]|eukprot:XP_008865894.1 hypothetical protein H310_03709 [Aphanomyces invadans]